MIWNLLPPDFVQMAFFRVRGTEMLSPNSSFILGNFFFIITDLMKQRASLRDFVESCVFLNRDRFETIYCT